MRYAYSGRVSMTSDATCLALIAVAVALGCGNGSVDGDGGAGGAGGSAGGGGDVCRGALEEYCSPCAAYDEAFSVAFEGYEICSGDGSPNTLPAAGTCGELRWIMTWNTLDEYVEYFDSDGAMVGATFATDVFVLCDGTSSTKDYGFVPECERTTTARACEPQ